MEHVYPPGPAGVPANLTAASSTYKRNAWLAMLGITAFIVVYFALSWWFAWTAWRLSSSMFTSGDFDLWAFVAALSAAFLAVFMLKALFFVKHGYEIEDLEITREDEPRLFEFIDRLADEARAPRAHKVYLSPRVNAAVFYDLSLLNLVLPSKKNLEIGLGLVNVLSLGELKAVLAHEFGHFAQRSMAVGRWVYIAQQIAGHVVARRDALDRLLQALSRIDLRVAWIGWLLSLIVWSIRSTMDVLFRAVLLAQRALSRQMEFQADLVAVSLTGSDALIHALHRLNAADDAWDKTLEFANDELNRKRAISDLFAVHSRIIDRMREILGQADYGIAPPVPAVAPDSHRLFKAAIAQPPRMWLTHPPSVDREQNAKRHYVAAPVDDRSSWTLFRDPQSSKEKMSAHVFRKSETAAAPMEKTHEQLDKEYGRAFLDRRYRGVYLRRSPVRHVATAGELYAPRLEGDVPTALAALYPESLAHDVETLNETSEQKQSLEALRDQVAQAPGGVIRHNGEELRRADLPAAIAALEVKIQSARERIEAHDRACRTAHLYAARLVDKGWPAYLTGLGSVLHYADHTAANLRDAQGYVANIYNVVTADGRVSSDEMSRLIAGCQELYRPLAAVYAQAGEVVLDRTLLGRLEVENWQAMLEEFKLSGPSRENISDWLQVIDGWVSAALQALGRLRVAALEQLLLSERAVEKIVIDHLPSADAPAASTVPSGFATLLPGNERRRQQKLDWWDRFHSADGIVPMIARSAVAVGIVGGVVLLGGRMGQASLTIYNALAQPVIVDVDGQTVTAEAQDAVTITLAPTGTIKVSSRAGDQLIESFEETLGGSSAHYVYNVAGGAALYEWTAIYTALGNSPPSTPHPLNAPRWTTTTVDHAFEEPPERIEMSGAQEMRRVLSSASHLSPSSQLGLVADEKDRERLVLAHVRWDDTQSAHYIEWLQLASTRPGFDSLLASRLQRDSHDIVLMRFEQDAVEGEKHDAVCARHRDAAAAQPTQPDLQYLAIRCDAAEKTAQDEMFLSAQKRWPEHPWLMYASGVIRADRGEYAEALPLLEGVRRNLAPLREYVTMEIARMHRLGQSPELARSQDMVDGSPRLAMFLSIEAGTGLENTPLEPFGMLARGELDQALRKSTTAQNARLVRLVAASDGASPEMIRAALDLPVTAEDDVETMFVMIGLASRENRDVAPYVNHIQKVLGHRAEPLLAFLDKIRAGTEPRQAAAEMNYYDLGLRFEAYNAAILLLRERAPGEWRDSVRRGLFVGERQFIAEPAEAT
jgi:Zn-dependent protease with chaperone function